MVRRLLALAVVIALGAPLLAGDEDGLFEHSGWASAGSPGGKTAWTQGGPAPARPVGTGPEERREAPWTPPSPAPAPPPPPPKPPEAKAPPPPPPEPKAAEADFFEHSGVLPPPRPKPCWLDGPRQLSRRWR